MHYNQKKVLYINNFFAYGTDFSFKVYISTMHAKAMQCDYYVTTSSQLSMKLHGSLLVIVCCLVVELCNFIQKGYLLFSRPVNDRNLFLAFQGVLFLLYPLVGHLTDVYLTRYHSLILSYGILIFTTCAVVVYSGIDLAASSIWKIGIFHHGKTAVLWFIMFLVYSVGLGLFQANAIQFGLDQLLEAPTPKLIAFIHALVLLGSECWQFGIFLCYREWFDYLKRNRFDDKCYNCV